MLRRRRALSATEVQPPSSRDGSLGSDPVAKMLPLPRVFIRPAAALEKLVTRCYPLLPQTSSELRRRRRLLTFHVASSDRPTYPVPVPGTVPYLYKCRIEFLFVSVIHYDCKCEIPYRYGYRVLYLSVKVRVIALVVLTLVVRTVVLALVPFFWPSKRHHHFVIHLSPPPRSPVWRTSSDIVPFNGLSSKGLGLLLSRLSRRPLAEVQLLREPRNGD